VIVSVILAGLLTLGRCIRRGAPLRGRIQGRTRASEEELLAARVEKDAAMQLLSDLEHDRGTGKLGRRGLSPPESGCAGAGRRGFEATRRARDRPVTNGQPIEQWIREERLRLEKEARR